MSKQDFLDAVAAKTGTTSQKKSGSSSSTSKTPTSFFGTPNTIFPQYSSGLWADLPTGIWGPTGMPLPPAPPPGTPAPTPTPTPTPTPGSGGTWHGGNQTGGGTQPGGGGGTWGGGTQSGTGLFGSQFQFDRTGPLAQLLRQWSSR